MKKFLLTFVLLSLCLTCFLVGCNGGEKNNLGPKYDATITVNEDNNGSGVANVSIFCDGNKVGETNSNGKYIVSNLQGQHEIKVSANGYLFESDKTNVSASSKEITFKAIKSFKLSGVVQSGDILIQGAKVKVAGDYANEILTDANGEFEIETAGNVTEITAEYQGVTFEKNSSGYDKTTQNDNIVFDGYYNKVIVVKSGSIKINDAEVKVTDNTGATYIISSGLNGEYVFNVYGTININVAHGGYDESEPVISNIISGVIQINKTFTLKGSVIGVGLEGIKISATGGITTTTNENGEFELSGLSGNVGLNVSKENYTYVYSADNAALNSKTYNFITKDINIKMQSFLISGAITSGSIKIFDAKVTSDKPFGSGVISTDAFGNFSIWVTEQCEIAFEKDRYTINNYHADEAKVGVAIPATYSVEGQVSWNKTSLESVLVEITDELGYYQYTTLADGWFSFDGLTGEAEITASSEDKIFNNMPRKITAESSPVNISNTSYSIEGYVKTGEIAVTNAQVKAQTGENCLTDGNGYYKFESLEGEITITAIKEGYAFGNVVVTSEQEGDSVDFSGTFKISGIVKSGDLVVDEALVKILGTDIEATTNSFGYYEFTGLDSEVDLEITKTGYTFTGTTNFTGANLNANFDSTYKVTVKVVIDSPVAGVLIYRGADLLGTTDASGECEITLSGTSMITFFKEGYDLSAATLKESGILDVSAAFIVVISVDLNGTFITSGFTIINDGQAAVLQENSYVIKSNTNIEIELKSDVYELISLDVQSHFNVSDTLYITFYAFVKYNISGRIQTYSGANTTSVSNYSGNLMIKNEYKINGITQPLYEKTVAANGYYTVSGFGTTTIIAENYLINSSKLYLIEGAKTVSSTTSDINFTLVAAKEFALHLFKEAERLSNEAVGRYVTVSGIADPSTGDNQQIFGFRTRDEERNIKNLAANYGSSVLGIDPRAACLTYVPKPIDGVLSNNFRTFKTTGSNIQSNFTFSTIPNASDTTRANYLSSMIGYEPERITPYIVAYNTIKSASLKLENGGWVLDFDFYTATNGSQVSAVTDYQKQINYLKPGSTSFKSWTSVKMVMTLNSNGYIKTIAYDEYYAISMIITINIHATPTETYQITDGTTKIPSDLQRNGIDITDGTGTIIAH